MIRLDATGFPLVRCAGPRLWVGLLPVTKVQFEYYLGDRTGFDRAAYDSLMGMCPRASWRTIPDDRPEELFLTGLLPEEAVRFAKWLGGGGRLPTAAEWRAADAAVHALDPQADALAMLDADSHPAARAILAWLRERRGTRWRPLALLEDGLLEWVGGPAEGYGLQGRPRPDLARVIQNPQVHDPIRPRIPTRHRANGFRLVCPIT